MNAITETGSAGFLPRYAAARGNLPGDSTLRAAAADRPVIETTSARVKVVRRSSFNSVKSCAARGPNVLSPK